MEESSNRGPIEVDRDSEGKFAPGRKKTGGKPKGKELTTLIREAVEDADDPADYAKLLGMVKELALRAAEPKDRIAAAKLWIEWRIPKDAQQLDIRVKGPMTEEELQQALQDASAAFDNR